MTLKIKYLIPTMSLLLFAFGINAQSYSYDIIKQKLTTPQDTSISVSQDVLPQSLLTQKTPFKKIYHNSLGLFCIAENKMAKSSRLPIKMRLGTVQYVDKIEGK